MTYEPSANERERVLNEVYRNQLTMASGYSGTFRRDNGTPCLRWNLASTHLSYHPGADPREGESDRQWLARVLLVEAAGNKRAALLAKLAGPRERVDADIAADEGDEETDADEPPDWETPDGAQLHATWSDRPATPDVIAEDIQARNPDFDKDTDAYDRIVGANRQSGDDWIAADEQWFTFPGRCGAEKALLFYCAGEKGVIRPTVSTFCYLLPNHEGIHTFNGTDEHIVNRPTFGDNTLPTVKLTNLIKRCDCWSNGRHGQNGPFRAKEIHAKPEDMTWYARHWRIDACPDCGQAFGHGYKYNCPANGIRKVV
jgi:hypothetical protein